MSAPSPIEQSCRHCGYGRRVDGTLVEALPGIVCPGHDLQTHQLQPSLWERIFSWVVGWTNPSGFVPNTTTFELTIDDFPDFLEVGDEDDSSIHASTMFNIDTDFRKGWFLKNLVRPIEWNLEHPYDILSTSHRFEDFMEQFKRIGYKVWDIQNKQHATSYLRLKSANNRSQWCDLAGRADFIITHLNATRVDYLNRIVGVVEVQSKDAIDLCEYQLLVYMLILMNAKQLPHLIAFLVQKDGQCRAFKATRGVDGECIYAMNSLFHVSHIANIFDDIAKSLKA